MCAKRVLLLYGVRFCGLCPRPQETEFLDFLLVGESKPLRENRKAVMCAKQVLLDEGVKVSRTLSLTKAMQSKPRFLAVNFACFCVEILDKPLWFICGFCLVDSLKFPRYKIATHPKENFGAGSDYIALVTQETEFLDFLSRVCYK